VADREALPQATKLNPAFFKLVYTDLLNNKKTAQTLQETLTAIDNYLADRTSEFFGLALDYLQEIGEARSATEIDDHSDRMTTMCAASEDETLQAFLWAGNANRQCFGSAASIVTVTVAPDQTEPALFNSIGSFSQNAWTEAGCAVSAMNRGVRLRPAMDAQNSRR